jgi:hypothetical protein
LRLSCDERSVYRHKQLSGVATVLGKIVALIVVAAAASSANMLNIRLVFPKNLAQPALPPLRSLFSGSLLALARAGAWPAFGVDTAAAIRPTLVFQSSFQL